MCFYQAHVLVALILMIVFGAGRTIAIKVFFQLGFEGPFLVSILMLFGHSLAIPLYYLLQWCLPAITDDIADDNDYQQGSGGEAPAVPGSGMATSLRTSRSSLRTSRSSTRRSSIIAFELQVLRDAPWEVTHIPDKLEEVQEEGDIPLDDQADEKAEAELDGDQGSRTPAVDRHVAPRHGHIGSTTGLSERSKRAVQWVHHIPYWAKPLVSSFFGFLDAVFRVLSVFYLPASIAEMLIGGLELLGSIVAARWIRKREIPRQRWYGAAVVVAGLVLIASADLTNNTNEAAAARGFGLGILFTVLKVVMGVLKDMSQELFMQEGGFSATLLLGLEGAYGLAIAIPLYFAIGPLTGENPVVSFQQIGQSALSMGYTIGLIFILFLAGLFSILGTAVTSAMTRNMWKNFRGLVVWIVALVIFYATGNQALGEQWQIPRSIMILFGYLIMMLGLYIYYRKKENEPPVSPRASATSIESPSNTIEGRARSGNFNQAPDDKCAGDV